MSAISRGFVPGWRFPQLLLLLMAVVAAQSWISGSVMADSEEPGVIERDPNLPANPNRVNEKHVKAYAGLAALAGIVIVGVAMAGLIVLWAGRLRRQLRQPLPDADLPDRDFWFLKPPKPSVTSSSLPDSHQPPHEPPPAD